MNLRKYANKKVIAIVTAIMLIFGGIIIQHNKIKNLEHEIYKYQNMTEQKYNYTETTPDVKSLEEDLNSVFTYRVDRKSVV